MKRILLLLSIAFLISCSNQPESGTKAGQENPESETTSDQNIISEPDAEPGTVVLEPEKIELDAKDATFTETRAPEIAQLFRQATAAYGQGDYQSGIAYFNQIVTKEPDNGNAYYNLGIGYFELEKFADAIQAFNQAIMINPMDPRAIDIRGRVYYLIGDYKNCLYDYARVVELKPDDPAAYYNRGTAKGRTHDYVGAIEDFDKAISYDPEYALAYFNRGFAYFKRGMLHDACYDWNKAHGLGHFEAEKAIKEYCEGGE